MEDFKFTVAPRYWISESDIGQVFRAVKKYNGDYIVIFESGLFNGTLDLTLEEVTENLNEEAWIVLQ